MGKTDEYQYLRNMYDRSMHGMTSHMIGYSSMNRTFLGEYKVNSNQLIPEMDHLVCYVPGMLALGAEGEKKEYHMQIAKDLLDTCLFLYFSQSTGIGPERTHFLQSPLPKDQKIQDFKALSSRYLLRPGLLLKCIIIIA